MARNRSPSVPILPAALGLAAVAGIVWLTRSGAAKPANAFPVNMPAGGGGKTIPVYFPDGTLTRARVDDALKERAMVQAVEPGKATSSGYVIVAIDKAARVARADRGDGSIVVLPFDTITQIL